MTLIFEMVTMMAKVMSMRRIVTMAMITWYLTMSMMKVAVIRHMNQAVVLFWMVIVIIIITLMMSLHNWSPIISDNHGDHSDHDDDHDVHSDAHDENCDDVPDDDDNYASHEYNDCADDESIGASPHEPTAAGIVHDDGGGDDDDDDVHILVMMIMIPAVEGCQGLGEQHSQQQAEEQFHLKIIKWFI